jgi:hypothetical protein
MIHGIETIKALNRKKAEESEALPLEEKKKKEERLRARTENKNREYVVCENCKNVVPEIEVVRRLCINCQNNS